MKKKLKKLLAILMVYAMMAPMALATLNDEGIGEFDASTTSVTQTMVAKGTYLDPAEGDIWKLKFPTEDLIEYSVDPLHARYNSEEKNDKQIDSSDIVLFKHFNDQNEHKGYSRYSDALTVENRGTVDVAVDLNVRVKNFTKDTLTYVDEINGISSSSNKPSILFAISDNSSEVKGNNYLSKVLPQEGKNFSSKLPAVMANFKSNIEDESKVKWEFIGGDENKPDNPWNKASYYLRGESNPESSSDTIDWNGKVTPDLTLTWFVRSTKLEVVEIKTDKLVSSDSKFSVAADRYAAQPGDTVTIFIKPDTSSDTSIIYEVEQPSSAAVTAKMYTANWNLDGEDGILNSSESSISLSGPTASEDGLFAMTFTVPTRSTSEGFTTKWKSGTTVSDTGNKVTFSGPLATVTRKLEDNKQ